MKEIVFVCTGNTCRSPMAEALFNNFVKCSDISAVSKSFGIFADGNSEMSANAKTALSEAGIDFSHKSVQITENDVKEADMIFGITFSHAKTLCSMFPEYADKIFSFPTDISDPYGSNIDVYRQCRDEIINGIKSIIEYLKNEE